MSLSVEPFGILFASGIFHKCLEPNQRKPQMEMRLFSLTFNILTSGFRQPEVRGVLNCSGMPWPEVSDQAVCPSRRLVLVYDIDNGDPAVLEYIPHPHYEDLNA